MNFFYIHKARFCYFVGVTFGFFLQNPWFFCLCVCLFFKQPVYFYRGVISSFCYLPGVKVNFCHTHKPRFYYLPGMLFIFIYLYLFLLFF